MMRTTEHNLPAINIQSNHHMNHNHSRDYQVDIYSIRMAPTTNRITLANEAATTTQPLTNGIDTSSRCAKPNCGSWCVAGSRFCKARTFLCSSTHRSC